MGPGSGRESALRALQAVGFQITSIRDVTRSRTTAAGRASAAASERARRRLQAAHSASGACRAEPGRLGRCPISIETLMRPPVANVLQKNWQDLIKPNKLEIDAGPRPQQGGDRRRRAARARLRHDARQRAAARAAVVAAGRRHHDRAHRRRAARVLLDPRRARGRDQHHPQHQGDRAARALRRRQAHGAEEGRPGTGQGLRHRGQLRGRDPQPRARHLHARPGRLHPHGVHGRAWARATCRPSATAPTTRRSA